jgi:hypothetical protein
MSAETSAGRARHVLERPRLLEQVRRARHDRELVHDAQAVRGQLVEHEHLHVEISHDEERRRAHAVHSVAGEIRPPAPQDDRRDFDGRWDAAINAAAAPVLAPK